jgi:hypothetical protein
MTRLVCFRFLIKQLNGPAYLLNKETEKFVQPNGAHAGRPFEACRSGLLTMFASHLPVFLRHPPKGGICK